MGNQGSLPADVRADTRKKNPEPLESYRKEKQRDEHLKNLGFKRSKSLRRSISKRLKRKSKKEPPPTELDRVDGGETQQSGSLVGQAQPLPNHVQTSEGGPRRMDQLRRSLRSSFRRKKDKGGDGGQEPTTSTTSTRRPMDNPSKPHQWLEDEKSVRSGICSFNVKYLGCVEVFECRGMPVCEEALKVLKSSKRKSVRSILYVNGDGLRVVDDETKGLIVDQTIEKVSFCAPDRNFERGFSYICRDGTTRRWMCHGFMAVKESGERLSHAVGCAFAICLEKKQNRDKDCNVSMTFDNKNASFTRLGSFRQATITERLQDPQGIKPAFPPPPKDDSVENPFAVARPHATDLMLQRQTSFRGFNRLQTSGSPFKRQLSLRLNELPSTKERQMDISPQHSSTIDSDIDAMCQQLSRELSVMSNNSANSNSILMSPFAPTRPICTSPLQTVPEDHALSVKDPTVHDQDHERDNNGVDYYDDDDDDDVHDNDEDESSTNVVCDSNPWDLVPDQPQKAPESPLIPTIEDDKKTASNNIVVEDGWSSVAAVLDDPFDAEWASLALRNNESKNPFNNDDAMQPSFQLQM